MKSPSALRATTLRYRSLIVICGAVIGLFCLVQGTGHSLDIALRDMRDGLHSRAATGDIVVAEIDARSLAAINQWPLPRSIHAKVIDRLAKAKARSIAFDVDFSSPSLPQEDALMASALERAQGAVILPTFRQAYQSQSGKIFENLPIAAFKQHAFLASVNVTPDADGMVRGYESGVVTQSVMRPSIAALLAETSSNRAGNLTIDYSIDPASIPRLSYIDILEGRVTPKVIAGKRILIGATAVESGDRYAVPRYGVIAGVLLQAMAAETLMQGSNAVHYGGWPLFAFAMIVLLVAGRSRSDAARAATFFGGLVVVLVVPLVLELGKFATLNASPALGTLFGGAVTMLILLIRGAIMKSRTTDAQTGLPNATAFSMAENRAPMGIVAAARIQHYGEISLILGADQTAEWIRQIVRRVELVAGGEAIYRVEENALLWIFHADDLEVLPERFAALAAVFRSPIIIGARSLEVSLSYGTTHCTAPCATLDAMADPRTLLAQALLAADRAAQQGILWDMHSALHGAEIDWKLSLLGELDQALAQGNLWVAYQPKADIRSGRINGAEALVRWAHPERGAIAPDHFIPLIEKEGRMRDMTLFVLDHVLATLTSWAATGYNHTIAVNISAPLLGDPVFLEQASDRIVAAGIDRALLIFEITESATLANPDIAIASMTTLRALGISLSIDDYGTGQSTLTYLKRLPVNEIKIDRSFVTDLTTSRNDQILVRSTIALAHDLGFRVVAEGIESAACLALLASYGCDVAQGWHIGKPMAADALTQLLVADLALAA